ncbi:MAG: hypothetical protein AB1487_09810 [Thermodesulfobacteriota bacterium]
MGKDSKIKSINEKLIKTKEGLERIAGDARQRGDFYYSVSEDARRAAKLLDGASVNFNSLNDAGIENYGVFTSLITAAGSTASSVAASGEAAITRWDGQPQVDYSVGTVVTSLAYSAGSIFDLSKGMCTVAHNLLPNNYKHGTPPVIEVESVDMSTEQIASEERLDERLNEISDRFINIRKGAWQTFRSNSQDKVRQAAHSMRELIRQVLDKLAPEQEVKNTTWFKNGGSDKITRKHRIKYILLGSKEKVPSKGNLKYIEALGQEADTKYSILSREAHLDKEPEYLIVETYLRSAESFLLALLDYRAILLKNECVNKAL